MSVTYFSFYNSLVGDVNKISLKFMGVTVVESNPGVVFTNRTR